MAGVKFKFTWTAKTMNERLAIRLAYKRQKIVFDGAVAAFIVAVAQEVSKHQDTGMSLASLFPTAAKVNAVGMPSIHPKRAKRKGLTYISGSYAPDQYKSAAIGLSLGEKVSRIRYGNENYPRFIFDFEIKVYQYLLHEFGYQTSAWHSLERGRNAFFTYLSKNDKAMFPLLSEAFSKSGSISTKGRYL